MLGFYVRMIDYITIETLVYLVKSNVSKFYNEMINRAANIRLFNTVVKYGKDCMVFHPDCEEFKDIVKSIIDGMVSDIGQVSRPLHYFNDLPMLETHGNIP